jgi:NADPH:quinone reductase-like Zn-dependent oxidoreductase
MQEAHAMLIALLLPCNPFLQFKKGDLVYFYLNPLAKFGTAAEFTLVPEDHACLLPKDTDIIAAAALPLVACTAWQVSAVHSTRAHQLA